MENVPDEFAGTGFHPDLEGGRCVGTLRPLRNTLQFDALIPRPTQPVSAEAASPDATPPVPEIQPPQELLRVELPYAGLVVTLGGAASRLIFFSNPATAGWSVSTTDARIMQHAEILNKPQLTEHLKKIHGTKRMMKIAALATALFFAALGVGLWIAKGPLVVALANRVPVSMETQLGDSAFQLITAQHKIIDDPVLNSQLNAMAKPLIDTLPDKRYTFTFVIIEDKSLNAFALPGGKVAVHSGLLLNADTPEQVLGVLAHEIAHVQQRHGMRKMINDAGMFIVVQGFLGDLPGVLSMLLSNAGSLLNHTYSRELETAADDQGWLYMEAANIDPRGLIEFFKKLKAEEDQFYKTTGIPQLSFSRTHPLTGDRIAGLEKKWATAAKTSDFRKFDLDFKGFQDKLRSTKK